MTSSPKSTPYPHVSKRFVESAGINSDERPNGGSANLLEIFRYDVLLHAAVESNNGVGTSSYLRTSSKNVINCYIDFMNTLCLCDINFLFLVRDYGHSTGMDSDQLTSRKTSLRSSRKLSSSSRKTNKLSFRPSSRPGQSFCDDFYDGYRYVYYVNVWTGTRIL